jgi:mRNA interferase MazF
MSVRRGEIYFADLDPVQGRKQAGRRPVLVLSIDAINRLPLVVTVVVGTRGERIPQDYPSNVRVSVSESGLPMETVFLCFQVRSLDPRRFPPAPADRLVADAMNRVEGAIRYCLGL